MKCEVSQHKHCYSNGSYLFAGYSSSCCQYMSDVLENGSVRGDANASADQNGNLVTVPVLVAFTIRSIQVDLRRGSHGKTIKKRETWRGC